MLKMIPDDITKEYILKHYSIDDERKIVHKLLECGQIYVDVALFEHAQMSLNKIIENLRNEAIETCAYKVKTGIDIENILVSMTSDFDGDVLFDIKYQYDYEENDDEVIKRLITREKRKLSRLEKNMKKQKAEEARELAELKRLKKKYE